MEYYVEVTHSIRGCDARVDQFKEYRNWCWQAFGPGIEAKWITVRPEDAGSNGECRMVSVDRWAWHTEYDCMRLYFKSHAELAFFVLKYGG